MKTNVELTLEEIQELIEYTNDYVGYNSKIMEKLKNSEETLKKNNEFKMKGVQYEKHN